MQAVTNEDGTTSTVFVPGQTTNTCPHNYEFMSQPEIEGIIEQQRTEMANAAAAAAAAAPPPADPAPMDDSNGGAQ